MRVQCCFCEYEEDGFCSKKKRGGKPTKIKTNKRRTCTSYSEEAVRVLSDYRKKERHKATLRNLDRRRALLKDALEEAKKKGVAALSKQLVNTVAEE